MCDPASAALIANGVGAGVQAYGSESAAKYQAAVANNNAAVAKQNAQYAIDVGNTQMQAKQQQTASMIGSERAMYGAAGVEDNSGSAVRVQSDTARLGAIDAATIKNNAARQAYGYQVQAAGFQGQASMDQAAGNLNAFSSIIGGASSIGSKWSDYQNKGITPGIANIFS